MTLVITNYGSAQVHLQEGEVLGKLHVVQMAEKTPAGVETAEQEEESHSCGCYPDRQWRRKEEAAT